MAPPFDPNVLSDPPPVPYTDLRPDPPPSPTISMGSVLSDDFFLAGGWTTEEVADMHAERRERHLAKVDYLSTHNLKALL